MTFLGKPFMTPQRRYALAISLILTILAVSAPFWDDHELVFPVALVAAALAYEAVWWKTPSSREHNQQGVTE